jgi:hypothetical protein
MPRTTAENTTDIQALQSWQALQNVRNVQVDMILEELKEQGKTLQTVVKQFETALNDGKLVTQRLEQKTDYIQRTVYVVGSILMLTLGTVIGQFIHFHPF